MKLIDRHISASVIKAILMTLLVLSLLIVLLKFIEEAQDVGKGDYQTLDAFIVSVALTPWAVYQAFPISALIGSLLGLGGLASHGELIAMRAAGVSLRHIIWAVLKAGLLLTVLVFIVGEVVVPMADQYGEQLRLEKRHQQVTLKTKYGFWSKDGNAFVNIKKILPGDVLEDIRIYEFDSDSQLKLVTRAENARFEGDSWMLEGVRQSSVSESAINSRKLAQATWNSFLNPALLSVIVVDPVMLPIWDIWDYARIMQENEQDAHAYEVAFWTKLATPISTVMMLILAIPFVLGSQRSVSMGQRILFGALLGSIFYFVSKGFSFVALVYDLYPVTASIFPVIAMVLLVMVLYRSIATR